MFGFIKTLSIELLTSIVNVFNSNKCVLLKTKDVDIYIYIYIYIYVYIYIYIYIYTYIYLTKKLKRFISI